MNGAAEQLLFASNESKTPEEWLRDGSVVVTSVTINPAAISTVTGRLLLSGDRKVVPLLRTEFATSAIKVSPDEGCVAYCSNESGQWEIYIAAFPTFMGKRRVSSSGGFTPLWRRDSKELFYLTFDGKVMSVNVRQAKGIETGPPRALLQAPGPIVPGWYQYSATGDGKRFIFFERLPEANKQFTVVLNWTNGDRGTRRRFR